MFSAFVLLLRQFWVVFAVDAVAADFAVDGGAAAFHEFRDFADGELAYELGNPVSLL